MLSLTAIEMGLPGFGLEMLADVTHGGAWHIGVLAAPGIPEMLLAGREREFLGQFAFPAMSATPGAITGADIDEFARTYSRPGGWRGAAGLYQSMLREGPDVRALAKTPGLTAPVLLQLCRKRTARDGQRCRSGTWGFNSPRTLPIRLYRCST